MCHEEARQGRQVSDREAIPAFFEELVNHVFVLIQLSTSVG